MLWLVLLLGILGLIFLLLCLPVRVELRYQERPEVTVRYLFLTYRFDPQKEKTPKKPKKKKKEKKNTDPSEKKSNPIKDIIQQNGWNGFLQLLGELARIAGGAGQKICKRIRLEVFELEMTVGGEDASDAAIRYGQACAVVYPTTAQLFRWMKIRKKKKRIALRVEPDFFTLENRVDFTGKVRLSPVWVLSAGLSAGMRFLKTMIRWNIQKIRKGTRNHE